MHVLLDGEPNSRVPITASRESIISEISTRSHTGTVRIATPVTLSNAKNFTMSLGSLPSKVILKGNGKVTFNGIHIPQ